MLLFLLDYILSMSALVTIDNIPRNYPPIAGEFSYFCSNYCGKENHYIVETFTSNEKSGDQCGCHFSSPINLKNVPFYTNQGIIKLVGKEIIRNCYKRT